MRWIMCLFLFLWTAVPAWADKVTLRTGWEVGGRIVEQTDRFVKIDLEGTILTFYFDEVDAINGQKVVRTDAGGEEASSEGVLSSGSSRPGNSDGAFSR